MGIKLYSSRRQAAGQPCSPSAIAHLDADAFFASVIVRKHPHLRGKPVFAIGMGGGCIIAATYEAKAKGVKTGMPLFEARKLCPGAIEMASDFAETGIASAQIESILRDVCPIVEQMSIDEWFLDLATMQGGIPTDLGVWAKATQSDVLRQTALSVSVGVGPSKTLAKMASEYRKPAGVTNVLDADIERFLRDRPAAAIPGIGRKRQAHADLHGWKTAWDFVQADVTLVQEVCGRPGLELQRELSGERVYELVHEPAAPKSISRCRTFKATRTLADIRAHMLRHLEYVVLKMRKQELACSIVCVWLRDRDFERSGLCRRLPQASRLESEILPEAQRCLETALEHGKFYNQVSLGLYGLAPAGAKQYSLFDDPAQDERAEHLQQALDNIHTKFGRNSLTRAAALQVKSGTTMGFNIPMAGTT